MSEWTRPAQPVRCVVELDKPLTVRRERGVLAQGDANANAIVAEVYSTAGKPYDLSGCAVQLIFVRPDNNALPAINAEISGNTATATLPDSAYAMSGMYSLRMQLRKNGAERTIVWIVGEVKGTDVDGIADPDHVISIGDIMASAKEAQTAASAANTAAERANAGAERAEQLQIDAGGLAGDSNKLGGKAPEYYLPVVQLLDNACWKYPEKIINQRGIKSGDVIPTWAYFFDRWKSRSGQLIVTFDDNDGVIVNGLDGYFYQITERKYSGESYSAAVAFADGEILVCSGNDQSYAGSPILLATAGNVTGEMVHIYRDTAERIETMFFTGSRRVLWLLLTPGTYTADTLPPVVPRPYAVELAECRRYYRYIPASRYKTMGEITNGIVYMTINLDTPMRVSPTVLLESGAKMYVVSESLDRYLADTPTVYTTKEYKIVIACNTDITTKQICSCEIGNGGINISADL